MKVKGYVYGEGGFDDTKPNNNVVEIEYYTAEEEAKLNAEEKAELEAAAVKAALLAKLGITEEEAKLLLS